MRGVRAPVTFTAALAALVIGVQAPAAAGGTPECLGQPATIVGDGPEVRGSPGDDYLGGGNRARSGPDDDFGDGGPGNDRCREIERERSCEESLPG